MQHSKQPSVLLIILAFAAVYITWGSTYFFIEMAVKHIPPMALGAVRFIIAGGIMLLWAGVYKGENIWNKSALLPSMISGALMLFVGNGSVIWAEQWLPSSFVAIFLASAPLWFLLLDKINWRINFKNKFTIMGVLVGLLGVLALFYEKIATSEFQKDLWPLIILCIANIGWTLGSLFSKYKVKTISTTVNSAWQMIAAGLVFSIVGMLDGEFYHLQWTQIPTQSWIAVVYLIIFGSIIGYSAYVFLLSVRSPTQVSTYAYVNPLVAVLLGVYFNHDRLSALQLGGLGIILCSVFFINLAKREQSKRNTKLNVQNSQ